MKKVLVTGGAGYIGSHTIVELLRRGYQVAALDNFVNSRRFILSRIEKISAKDIAFYELDMADQAALAKVFKKEKDISAVIHFASLKAAGQSVAEPLRYYRNNLFSLLNLLAVMEKFQVNSLIFSSSACVYGRPERLPVAEDAPIAEPANPYGNIKKISEEIIRDLHAANRSFSAVLLRYFNPIGAHPSGLIGELPVGEPNNLVPFIAQTASGIRKQLKVFGSDYNTPDGTGVRDYLHIMDLADAHIAAMEYIFKNRQQVEAFNLGTGQGHSVLEIIKRFENVNGLKVNYKIVGRRPGDPAAVYADPGKANKYLKWQAQRSLDQALADAWNWEKKYRRF